MSGMSQNLPSHRFCVLKAKKHWNPGRGVKILFQASCDVRICQSSNDGVNR